MWESDVLGFYFWDLGAPQFFENAFLNGSVQVQKRFQFRFTSFCPHRAVFSLLKSVQVGKRLADLLLKIFEVREFSRFSELKNSDVSKPV